MLDAAAQREPEDEDEQECGDHRGRDRLAPQLQHAQDLARGERREAATAYDEARERPERALLAPDRELAHEAIALT